MESILEGSLSRLSNNQKMALISQLPRLSEEDIVSKGLRDSSCPICLTPYLALLAEEEMAFAMDSAAHHPDDLGVTQPSQTRQCGHVFCRKDISRWILDGHDACPLCRRPFLFAASSTSPRINSMPVHFPAPSDPYTLFLDGLSWSQPPSRNEQQENDSRNQFNGMYS